MAHVVESIDKLRSLLRGELSAVETYLQAIEKFDDDHVKNELQGMLDGHRRAVKQLGALVSERGGEPDTSSGPWGSWARLFTGAAKMVGPDTTLLALREGEDHGAKEYQEALGDDDVDAECKDIIRSQFLPAQRDRLERLEGLAEFYKNQWK